LARIKKENNARENLSRWNPRKCPRVEVWQEFFSWETKFYKIGEYLKFTKKTEAQYLEKQCRIFQDGEADRK
jgi:hypothetical protein